MCNVSQIAILNLIFIEKGIFTIQHTIEVKSIIYSFDFISIRIFFIIRSNVQFYLLFMFMFFIKLDRNNESKEIKFKNHRNEKNEKIVSL